jgi:hypothetical protein
LKNVFFCGVDGGFGRDVDDFGGVVGDLLLNQML